MSRPIALAAVILIFTLGGLPGSRIARGQEAESGIERAAVIAQGVAPMPAEQLAWRITAAAVSQTGERAARTAPGFVLVDEGTLAVNDLHSTAQMRLEAEEAAFLTTGAEIQEAPLEATPATLYRIDLVAVEQVNDAEGDDMVFVGQPFASPGGNRELELVRDVLAEDDSLTLSQGDSAAPLLLLVTAGAAELTPEDDPSATPLALPAGEAVALKGDVIVRAADPAGAAFVTAQLGPEVPPVALAQEVPAAEPATLTLQALACPATYAGENFAVDCAAPLPELAFNLTGVASGLSVDAVSADKGIAAFTDLPPDAYTLSGGAPGEFAQQAVACADAVGATVPAEAAGNPGLGTTLNLAAGQNVTCVWYVIPDDLQGAAGGSAALAVYLCPGTPNDPAAECTPGDATGTIIAGPATLTTDAGSDVPAQATGAAWLWGEPDGLPFGTYTVQTQGIAVPAGYELSEIRGAASGDTGWGFSLDETNPDAVLSVIFVPTAAPQEQTADLDTDADGLTDVQETKLGTDPANPDSDGDGLADGPEQEIGANALLPDTDGDGFSDNDEAEAGTSPRDPASQPQSTPTSTDSDGDALTDTIEVGLGTDPNNPDSDGDGQPDGVEVAIGSDPRVGG